MDILKEIFEESGNVLILNSKNPIKLNEKESVYRVCEEYVDIFAVKKSDNKSSGRNFHIARFKKGELIFNLPEYGDMYFVVLGHSDVRLNKIDINVLVSLEKNDSFVRYFSQAIDKWLENIYKILKSDQELPKFFTNISNRNEHFTDGEILKAVGRESILWLCNIEGEANLYGIELWNITSKISYFPLYKHSWIKVNNSFKYTLCDTKSILKTNKIIELMDIFHDFIVQAMYDVLTRYIEKEAIKLKNKISSDSSDTKEAFLKLASIVDENLDNVVNIDEDIDPHILVCKLVGSYLKLDILESNKMHRNTSQRDPIEKIAKDSSLMVRRVILNDTWYKEDCGPIVGYYSDDGDMKKKRPVALLPTSFKSYKMVDPETKESIHINSGIASNIDGIGYMFYKPLPNKILNKFDIFKFSMFGLKKELTMIVLIGLLIGLMALAVPIFTGKLFDVVIPTSNHGQLIQITGALIGIAFSLSLFNFIRGIATDRVRSRIGLNLQSAIWGRLLSLPVSFFRRYDVGDLTLRANGVGQIREILSDTVLSTIINGFFSIFSIMLLFYYNKKVAFIALILVTLATIYNSYIGYIQVKYQEYIMEKEGKITGFVLQLLTGIEKLRVANAEKRVFYEWTKRYKEQQEVSFNIGKNNIYLEVFNKVFPIAASIVIFVSVLSVLKKGHLFSTGDFIAFNVAFAQFLTASISMSGTLMNILKIVPIYKRLKPILGEQPEVKPNKINPGFLSGNIEINNVCFSYNKGEKEILHAINISVLPGQFVAIVGSSGSGKSTILRLLLGFEKPTSGSIYFDEQNLAELNIDEVRSQIGTVLQNGQIVQGDIYNNIVGATGLDLDSAWEAAKMAGFDKDIEQMPMGMQTIINSGGTLLSGGQRQRLIIARALVTKPRIVFFDEATSALDNRTQSIVTESLNKLDATRIVIAHRLSTIIQADKIYVIDKGKIIQEGNYDSLMQTDGAFKELVMHQVL